jgi:hypothetical protein
MKLPRKLKKKLKNNPEERYKVLMRCIYKTMKLKIILVDEFGNETEVKVSDELYELYEKYCTVENLPKTIDMNKVKQYCKQ